MRDATMIDSSIPTRDETVNSSLRLCASHQEERKQRSADHVHTAAQWLDKRSSFSCSTKYWKSGTQQNDKASNNENKQSAWKTRTATTTIRNVAIIMVTQIYGVQQGLIVVVNGSYWNIGSICAIMSLCWM